MMNTTFQNEKGIDLSDPKNTSFTSGFRYRGVYSEIINPANSKTYEDKSMQGPDTSIIYQTQQKQRVPRAFNLASRSGSRPRPPPSAQLGKQGIPRQALPPASGTQIVIPVDVPLPKRLSSATRNPPNVSFTQTQQEQKSFSRPNKFKPIGTEQSESTQKVDLFIDPKILEPYVPIPGRVPRKVAIDRKKKEYASFRIEDLLVHENIDFNQERENFQWLKLEQFDDTTFDDYQPDEWMNKKIDEDGKTRLIGAKGLFQDAANVFSWKNCIVESYDKDQDVYNVKWTHNNQSDQLHRIRFCMNAEDPRKFSKRIANAFRQMLYADSIIRYNYYIDNMPLQDLSELDTEQKKRLEALSKTKLLENMDTTQLIIEVNNDYCRTMNRIIFNKYMEDTDPAEDDLFPKSLQLPPQEKKPPAPYLGIMPLERHKGVKLVWMENYTRPNYEEPKEFNETFQDFCFASLFIKEEVIKALQEIRVECNKVLEMNIFNPDIQGPLVLEEFKHIQESSTSQTLYHLKGQWISDLIKIIKTNFEKVGKGWFNMKETNPNTYNFGKLKRFLTVVRLMMQDTVLTMVKKCFYQMQDKLINFLPEKVTIKNVTEITNEYNKKQIAADSLSESDPFKLKDRKISPLFTIDLIKTQNDEEFLFSVPPVNYVKMIITLFEKALEEIGKIPDLEPKILPELHASAQKEAHIKAPIKPRERPVTPDPNLRPKKYPDENKWIWEMLEFIKEKFMDGITPLNEYLEAFGEFKEILQLNPDEFVRNLEMLETPWEIEQIQDEIFKTREKEERLRKGLPEKIHVSYFQIQTKEILAYLCEKYYFLQKNLIDMIAKRARSHTQYIFNSYVMIQTKIKENPKDIEQLTELREYMKNIPIEIEKLKVEQKRCFEVFGILEQFNYRFSKDDLDRKWNIYGAPKESIELIERREKQLEKEQVRFEEEMHGSQDDFKEVIDNLERTISNFDQYVDSKSHEEVAGIARDINKCLIEFTEDARKFNQRETLFGMETTDYSKITTMQREFQPYSNLWITLHTWVVNHQTWMTIQWDKLDSVYAEKFVDESIKLMVGVIRFLKDRGIEQVLKIAVNTKAQLEEFKPKVPLLVALRKNGMMDRHWQQVSAKAGKEIRPTVEGFNFSKVLELGLLEHIDACVEIGERAFKEYNIQLGLEEMKRIWEDISFTVIAYKTSFIIRGYDEIQLILDEHIMNTQAMQFSPFKKPFEEEIINWNSALKTISDVLEEWAKCQGQWMYLQPIFDSQDIAKQLPGETKKFRTVDSTWKHTMSQAKVILNVKSVCLQENLLERLREANKNLEIIQKELNNYLEKKRDKFARFYFLSNDDLLEILSQTKEPTAVQPHLKKVFENINLIEFDGAKKITAMFSAENEKVDFVKHVDPNHKNVEDWMGEVETMMCRSVRQALLNSVNDYQTKKRDEWVLCHPGQCILNGSQIVWTSDVEKAFQNGVEGVKEYWGILETYLNDLVTLVRKKLTKQQKVTLNALIVLDVHAKDLVEKLWRENVKNAQEFEWISQLRYYWEDDECRVKCIQTNFPYGYEYLGNTLRLVITPLTDKCYMTLMGALKLNLGGAPAGPAGTGKTESTKDLAKALAKQCVVFNCSDSMDYIMIGKFFKGLASAGAWCCFDEFNRINIEVLSVIAQQLLVLFGEKAKGSPNVEFEGSIIRILPTFSVFITMNPGYAGRTELPDNLKALFRSVAMMVPDYAMIGEIMLYSFGFSQGRQLAKKMVATFKLSSEQLSSQDHYDYGMRAVRSVINAAGLLKAAEPLLDEQQLLLRALRDVNVPKFLKDDLPLFENIMMDLFPGISKPSVDYGNLIPQISKVCMDMKFNLQSTEPFVSKIIQLYDTTQVRHGLMIVGPTGGGKTSNYKVLQKAMSDLENSGFAKVNVHILNPKSITMGQLYGQFNEQTHEWTDGILAYRVRECCKDTSNDKHWVMFDGPVDAIWIESMNTVLDDNKKLCLNSGQILTLTPHMTMMFEVEDLTVASPATVSRCGMIYMEPESLGVQPLIESWLLSIPKNVKSQNKIINKLKSLSGLYIESSLEFMRHNLREPVATKDNNLVQSLHRILNCFIVNFAETDIKKVPQEDLDNFALMIEPLFIFALTWSIGCTTDETGREKFNTYIHQQLVKNASTLPLTEEMNIYEYEYSLVDQQYHTWEERNVDFKVDSKLAYHEVMIPTQDSTRNIYLLKLLIQNNYHVLSSGPTGTAKTQNIFNLLTTQLSENYQYISITFSAQTSANQTQDTIDNKMDKRRKGVFGPPIGKKCIIFVDDLNMPKKEEYGAQPPIELIRQYLDHDGWYNRKDLLFMRMEELIVLTAMGPPGGGRTFITNRMVRHFNVIGYTELDDNTIKCIFQTLVDFFLRRHADDIKAQTSNLVQGVLSVYSKVKNELLPTPSKSHYTFNLREIWRVIQGICSTHPSSVPDLPSIVRLWYHENMRVFSDRLTTLEDREYLKQLLCSQFKLFEQTTENVLGNNERLIFCDFMNGREAEPKVYTQITDLQAMLNRLESYQEDYNSDNSFVFGGQKAPMKLVMFLDACEHIARVARIIRLPNGHALLLGIGGSGRQSLARMATFLTNYKIFQIEVVKNYSVRAWRDDLKKVLMFAGIENKPISFLFCDTQIIREQMMEDLNNILNSGDVTGIYQDKDQEDIMSACKTECIKRNMQPTKMNIFTQYLVRVRKNIHIIIAMSPLGSAFTTRLRMFPGLVNNCTIDWFSEWPEEALIGVGKGQLSEYEEELQIEGKVEIFVDMFKTIHKSVEKVSVQYLEQLRRHNYVTPTSYLELLSIFRTIMLQKKVDLKVQITRLKSGLDKLQEANKSVAEMKIILKDMQPKLEQSSIETEKMMEHLKIDKAEADAKQKVVAVEEIEATKQQKEATKLAEEAELAVASANKVLNETLLEVQKLKSDHLNEIKSMGSPPNAVKVTLAAVVILNTDRIKRNGGEILMQNKEGQIGKKEENYFETAKRYLLSNTRELMDCLVNYDKDNISKETIAKLESKVMSQPDFNYPKVESSSYACKYLFLWVKAMVDYYKVFTGTKPQREKLVAVKKLVLEKTAELKLKKDALEEVNQKIAELQKAFDEKIAQKEALTKEINDCQVKLDRAQKLTDGLSEEKERWGKDIEKLSQSSLLIPGHSIISAGMITYSGPFTSHFRTKLEQHWLEQLNLKIDQIPFEKNITMRGFLGVPVTIQQWNIAGLPKDETSTENGIIINKTRRWPLMIDPQYQANKFIKNLGKEHEEGIEIIKASDPNLMKVMELSVQFGRWVLMENVGIELDPSLEPILGQQTTKSGSSLIITIGDKNLQYSEQFKLFLTTTLSNPHYPPETFVKVTMINFAITASGLEEQMLAQIVALENPNLESKKIEIVKRNAADQRELLRIEDSILKSLAETSDIAQILKDESLITQLQNSKKFAGEINQRVKESKQTEIQIDVARESYRPVAFRTSLLFFAILDLSTVDPMYQYSLQWFTNLFVMSVENAPSSTLLEERLTNLNNYFTYSLYQNICRSLFEKHKLLFSLILTVKILFGSNSIDEKEWRYFLAGPIGDIEIAQNPTNWINENTWPDMYRQFYGMSQLQKFIGIDKHFLENTEQYRVIFDSTAPQSVELPAPWNECLNSFQKMIVLKAIRPDKLIPAIQTYITEIMGGQYIVVPTFELAKCYKDSSIMTPLIFVLSTGSDPIADFLKFADEMTMQKRIESISLGQGQGPKAEKMIKENAQRGGWVLLQNCHLAESWMTDMERLCEDLNDNMHKDFRLWLTSMPTSYFPVSVLQNGIKMTMEPPQGLRANLLRTYKNLSDTELNDCAKPDNFKKLLFGFCLFHAIIQDRRKFGPIGWNIPYEFTNEDLTVCKKQLKMLLDEYKEIPYKVINFLGAEINYGGRVTDDKDVRLIKTILQGYINRESLRDGYKYSESGLYYSPSAATLEEYLTYISQLPLNPAPEAFGLHDNAEITNSQNETRVLLETILSVQARTSSKDGKSREQVIEDIRMAISKNTPELFDVETVSKLFPTSYNESMNTVLVQELIRYNRMIDIMKTSLVNLQKGLKGLVVLSEELEKIANSLFDNQVPRLWADKGFLSLKPLSSWIIDLNDRINFLSGWIKNGTPQTFWISGFFFPQAFITGTMQNYARRHGIAIDKLQFEFLVIDGVKVSEVTQKPEDGCYVYGLYLEGARWDYRKHMLQQPMPKELYSDLPMLHLLPISERQGSKESVYNCPVYKVVSRAGTLSTTGHSTNFVLFMELPSKEPENTWIRAGVAAFLSLRY